MKEIKRVCQNCKFHTNKPSTCHAIKEMPAFTGRKNTCDGWKRK